jgi:hypothetical protein
MTPLTKEQLFDKASKTPPLVYYRLFGYETEGQPDTAWQTAQHGCVEIHVTSRPKRSRLVTIAEVGDFEAPELDHVEKGKELEGRGFLYFFEDYQAADAFVAMRKNGAVQEVQAMVQSIGENLFGPGFGAVISPTADGEAVEIAPVPPAIPVEATVVAENLAEPATPQNVPEAAQTNEQPPATVAPAAAASVGEIAGHGDTVKVREWFAIEPLMKGRKRRIYQLWRWEQNPTFPNVYNVWAYALDGHVSQFTLGPSMPIQFYRLKSQDWGRNWVDNPPPPPQARRTSSPLPQQVSDSLGGTLDPEPEEPEDGEYDQTPVTEEVKAGFESKVRHTQELLRSLAIGAAQTYPGEFAEEVIDTLNSHIETIEDILTQMREEFGLNIPALPGE